MAGETMRFRNPAGHAGLFNNLVSLANSLAAFFETRFSLFARESKGALVHLLHQTHAASTGPEETSKGRSETSRIP